MEKLQFEFAAGQPALRRELSEYALSGHDQHAAGQREVAFAGAQRLAGQVQGHQ